MVIVVGSRVCAIERSSGNKYSADVKELVYNGAKLMVWGYPGYPNGILAIFAYTDYTEGDCAGIPPPPVCVPVWNCELPLNGWEADGCGNRRGNWACNPPIVPKWNVSIYARDSVTGAVIQGATVNVGTQSKVTDAVGMALFTVDQGTISILISKTGYTAFNTIEPVFTHSTFIYLLVSSLPPPGGIYGKISFSSLPIGAEIFLNDQDKGIKTPNILDSISPGLYPFTLKLSGYNDFTGVVTVVGGITAEVYAVLTLSSGGTGTGSLKLISTPDKADIIIDGQPYDAKTPAIIPDLPTGTHTYILKKTGFTDITGTVDVGLNRTNIILATFTAPGAGKGSTGSTAAIVIVAGLSAAVIYTLSKKKESKNGLRRTSLS